jgi:hypothetical protein
MRQEVDEIHENIAHFFIWTPEVRRSALSMRNSSLVAGLAWMGFRLSQKS